MILFAALNLSISVIASQVITSTLSVSNSARSKLATFDDKLSRDRFFKVIRLLDINAAKSTQLNVGKGVTSGIVVNQGSHPCRTCLKLHWQHVH